MSAPRDDSNQARASVPGLPVRGSRGLRSGERGRDRCLFVLTLLLLLLPPLFLLQAPLPESRALLELSGNDGSGGGAAAAMFPPPLQERRRTRRGKRRILTEVRFGVLGLAPMVEEPPEPLEAPFLHAEQAELRLTLPRRLQPPSASG